MGATHIGDMLYNTGSLPHLAAGLPDCRWTWVAEAPASAVLAGNPCLEAVISRADLSKQPRGNFDVAICYNSSSTWRDLIFAAKLGLPNRVGYADKGFSGLVTRSLQIRHPQPYPAYFRDLVSQVTGQPPTWSLQPRIYPNQYDEKLAAAVWDRHLLTAHLPVVACFVTSRQPYGVWPAESFAKTVAKLEASGACSVILCGTKGDIPQLELLKARFCLRSSIIAGELELLSLSCLLRRCAVVLCPDSGPRHIANAVGTRVVFVRNLAVGKIETGAYCETEIDAAPDVEEVATAAQPRAFKLLTPEQLAARVLESLSMNAAQKIRSR